MNQNKRIRVGDVFQILTSEGVCYGQVIHKHPKYAFVIAIFKEFFPQTPNDFSEVVSKEPQFVTTFLIQHAVNQKLFAVVANCPVSASLSEFPIFRGTNNLKGEDTTWWFWDGEREWKVDRQLTDEEKKYPEGPSLPSAPLIIEMIENNYRVERDYI